MLDISSSSESASNVFMDSDIQMLQREQDLLLIEQYLKQHELFGKFFTNYWNDIKDYIRLVQYHRGIQFTLYGEISREIHILYTGSVVAYVITNDSPKLLPVYKFKPTDLIAEFGALFATPKRYGFLSEEDCMVITLDLNYIEHLQSNNDLYLDFINLIYSEIGRIAVEIYNFMLCNQIDLENLLSRYGFFPSINKLSPDQLKLLSKASRYIFLPTNSTLLDEFNEKYIYLIETGSVQETRVFYNRNNLIANNKAANNDIKYKEIDDENTLNQIDSTNYNGKNNDNEQDVKQHISFYNDETIIKENMYQNETVGADLLSDATNIKITAITTSPACVLEIDINELIPKTNIHSQAFEFLTNKKREVENSLFITKQSVLELTANKVAFMSLGFFVTFLLAIFGILGRFVSHSYFTINTHVTFIYHASIISLMGISLAYLVHLYELQLSNFGFSKYNLKNSLMQALIASLLAIIIITGIKAIYIDFYGYKNGEVLFTLDLLVHGRKNLMNNFIFLIIFIANSFLFEFYIRGVMQNIFTMLIVGSENLKNFGGVIASTVIGSQLNLLLYDEFGPLLFIASLGSGLLYIRTKNLIASCVFHIIVVLYTKLILGILATSYF